MAINSVQVLLIGLGGLTWNSYFRQYSLLHVGHWHTSLTEGLAYWFGGTFVFYWWHRLRHANGFWLVFHQLHHSPVRIELLTSFYKHPVEILADSVITSFCVFFVLGGTAEVAAWTSLFGATGEYFLPFQHCHTQVARLLYPAARASLHSSPARLTPLQLRRHYLVGPAVWHVQRGRRLCPPVWLSAPQRAADLGDGDVP
ncbi:MAG: sterol desaturase family protein [Hymenobacter sp.]